MTSPEELAYWGEDGYDYTSQRQIIARMEEAFYPVPIYEGLVDDNEMVKLYAKHGANPVIIINFSGAVAAPKRYLGILGAAHDTNEIATSVQVISTSQEVSNRILSKVSRVLLGYAPDGCGEMSPALYSSPGKINSLGTPTRYTSIQIYTHYVNSKAVC